MSLSVIPKSLVLVMSLLVALVSWRFSVVKHEGHGSLDAEHDETPGHQGDKQAHHQHK